MVSKKGGLIPLLLFFFFSTLLWWWWIPGSRTHVVRACLLLFFSSLAAEIPILSLAKSNGCICHRVDPRSTARVTPLWREIGVRGRKKKIKETTELAIITRFMNLINNNCLVLFILRFCLRVCGIVKSEARDMGWEQWVGISRAGMDRTTPTAGTDFCTSGAHSMNFGCPFTFSILLHVTYFFFFLFLCLLLLPFSFPKLSSYIFP